MNQEQARRRLPDLAAGELNALDAWSIRQWIAKSPQLQKEWREISALYQQIHDTSQVTPGLPPPQWATAETPTADRPASPRTDDWLAPPTGRWRFILPAVSVTVLAALFVVPLTSWLVRSETRVAFGAGLASFSDQISGKSIEKRSFEGVLRQNPRSFPLHFGVVMLQSPSPSVAFPSDLQQENYERLNALQKLLPEFAGEPALYARLLDYPPRPGVPGTPGDMGMPWTPPANNQPWKPDAKVDTAALSRYLEDAKQGEAIDPDNMYFPIMRAYGLLAAQRADDAMAAVRDAGTKQHFKDYYAEEVEAKWEAIKAKSGEPGAIARLTVAASTLYSSFARLREVARCTTGRAIALEQEGRIEEGFALRVALLRLGSAMQQDGTSYICNLVGTAIGAIAMNRPGGSPPIDLKQKWSESPKNNEDLSKRLTHLRLQLFARYAGEHGHPEAAALARDLIHRDEVMRKNFARATQKDPMGLGIKGVIPYILSLAGSYTLLLSVLWTSLFGGIAFLLVRTRGIDRGEKMHPAVRWGFALFVTPTLILLGLATLDNIGLFIVPLATMLGLLCLWQCSQLRTGVPQNDGYLRRVEPRRNLKIAGLTVVTLYAVIGIAAVICSGPIGFLRDLSILTGMQAGDAERSVVPGSVTATVMMAGISLAVPLLALIILAIISYTRKLPASVGMVRGFRRIAVPMASILLLLYGGVVLAAAVQDVSLRGQLNRQVRGEIRFYTGQIEGGAKENNIGPGIAADQQDDPALPGLIQDMDTIGESRHLAHILVTTVVLPKPGDTISRPLTPEQQAEKEKIAKAKIWRLFQEIKLGKKTWQEAAKESEDTSTAQQDGDLGWVKKEQLDPDFGRAAFGVNVGGIAGPVRSRFGWHIIRVLETRVVNPPQ